MKKNIFKFAVYFSLLAIPVFAGFHPPVAGGGGGTPGGSNTQIQYNNAGSFGGDSGLATNGSGVFTHSAGSYTLNNNIDLRFGTTGLSVINWETADANANSMFFTAPEGDATNVPVFVFGDASIRDTDLGLFNGRTHPTISVFNDDATGVIAIGHGSSGYVFSSRGGLEIVEQTTDPYADRDVESFVFKPSDRDQLTPSFVNTYPTVLFRLSDQEKNFLEGTQGITTGFEVEGVTYTGSGAGTQFFGVANFASKIPVQGTDASIGTGIAAAFGNIPSSKTPIDNLMTVTAILSGITDGTGAVEGRRGFQVSSSIDGSGLDLGNQTSTLDALEAYSVEDLEPFSTTNVRTIERFALFHAKEQTLGANVTITEGPYAFLASANSGTKNDVRFEGLQLSTKDSETAAANIVSLRPLVQVDGNTQIDTMTKPLNDLTAIVVLTFTGTPTIKHNTAGTGASFQLAGAADFAATAGDTLMLIFDGTYWREISRTVI